MPQCVAFPPEPPGLESVETGAVALPQQSGAGDPQQPHSPGAFWLLHSRVCLG